MSNFKSDYSEKDTNIVRVEDANKIILNNDIKRYDNDYDIKSKTIPSGVSSILEYKHSTTLDAIEQELNKYKEKNHILPHRNGSPKKLLKRTNLTPKVQCLSFGKKFTKRSDDNDDHEDDEYDYESGLKVTKLDEKIVKKQVQCVAIADKDKDKRCSANILCDAKTTTTNNRKKSEMQTLPFALSVEIECETISHGQKEVSNSNQLIVLPNEEYSLNKSKDKNFQLFIMTQFQERLNNHKNRKIQDKSIKTRKVYRLIKPDVENVLE